MNVESIKRRETRKVTVGNVAIGGNEPISVQSMTKTDTRDVEATVAQIEELESVGCDIVRVALPDSQAAEALKEIKQRTSIPVVADIHFDYRLALKAVESGADKLRINPGNIGGREKVEQIASAAKERDLAIRIGVNAGSLERELLERYEGPGPEALVESALRHVAILEGVGFDDIVISLKASDVPLTVQAYRLMSKRVDYPLHIGVTEAGTVGSGSVRSAVGLGILLAEGIGDTLRVSLTGHPREEVRVGYGILRSLRLREYGPLLISCPICGRCEVDLQTIANEVEHRLQTIEQPITVAVMGCVVNGPGEARHADIGIAAGRGTGILFRRGEVVRKIKEEEFVDVLMSEVEAFIGSMASQKFCP
ncbi:MAG: flavodoxin-dependent (E)-4-hydroxy-3-methylbut-2-enyl-diphosphate synthase [bacterium]